MAPLSIVLFQRVIKIPAFKTDVTLKHGDAWQTPLATSYRCTPATRLNMTGDTESNTVAYLTLTKLQEEAFRTVNGSQFSAGELF